MIEILNPRCYCIYMQYKINYNQKYQLAANERFSQNV